MQTLVEGGQELSPYLQWQKDMREQDLQEELAKIDRRHLEGRIGYDEVVAARSRVMERNQKAAQLTKEEVCHQPAFTVCGLKMQPPPTDTFSCSGMCWQLWTDVLLLSSRQLNS